MKSDKLLYIVLDTISETCAKTEKCKDCKLSDHGYCTLDREPRQWNTKKIKENLEEVTP